MTSVFEWSGDAMVPLPRYKERCRADYVVGERYTLEAYEERSHASHGHYFASVNEAWKNLHEDIAKRFPSPEHLRKWALVRTGWCDTEVIALANHEEARLVAGTIRRRDAFCVITVEDCRVMIYTAKSQSYRKMSKEDFQRSKDAVLTYLAEMLDVKRQDLERWGGKSA